MLCCAVQVVRQNAKCVANSSTRKAGKRGRMEKCSHDVGARPQTPVDMLWHPRIHPVANMQAPGEAQQGVLAAGMVPDAAWGGAPHLTGPLPWQMGMGHAQEQQGVPQLHFTQMQQMQQMIAQQQQQHMMLGCAAASCCCPTTSCRPTASCPCSSANCRCSASAASSCRAEPAGKDAGAASAVVTAAAYDDACPTASC